MKSSTTFPVSEPGRSGNAVGSHDGVASGRLRLAAAGGLLGAIAASSCCILPLVLFGLGAGGAWIGNLSALSPYQPLFVTAALGFIGYGFYLVHRKRRASDCDGNVCAAAPGRTVYIALWVASFLVVIAVTFPYVAPLILGV